VQDVLIDGVVRLVALQPEDMTNVTDAAEKYKLDFDDAYQYGSPTAHRRLQNFGCGSAALDLFVGISLGTWLGHR